MIHEQFMAFWRSRNADLPYKISLSKERCAELFGSAESRYEFF